MNYSIISVLALVTTFVAASQGQQKSLEDIFNGPDRTITWQPWRQMPEFKYQFRTGDRYLGNTTWEHYLGFAESRSSAKAIKLSMVRLANEDGLPDALICPGLRYAIFKITNGKTTAHRGVWSWIAQEVDDSKANSVVSSLDFKDHLLSAGGP